MKIILLICLVVILVGFVFYKKQQKNVDSNDSEKQLFFNNYVNQKLFELLRSNYPELDFKLSGDTVSSKTGISIHAETASHTKYPQRESFQINFFTSHHFLEIPIEERLSGVGENDTAALQYGVQSFLAGQFPVIIDAIALRHSPEMDFDIIGQEDTTHWHPIIGDIQMQGALSRNSDSSIYEKTYGFIKPFFIKKLKDSDKSFHWFRYYICKMQDGEIMGDCYYDNEPCDEGLEFIRQYASTWEFAGKFGGQKQFIMFRRCGN